MSASVCLEEYMHFGLVENVLYAGSKHTWILVSQSAMSLNMWHIETFNLFLIFFWLFEMVLSQSWWNLEENGQYINSGLCR